MVDFTRDIKGTTGVSSITPVKPTPTQDPGSVGQGIFMDLAARAVRGGMRGHAISEGAEVGGRDQSFQDVAEQAQLFEEREAELLDEEGGPVTQARLKDIRTQALKDINATIRTVKSLVASGKMRSTEAKAHVEMALNEKRANPITAMFEEDFMNATAEFTGGPAGLAQIGISPEERHEQLMAKAREEAILEREQKKQEIMYTTKLSEDVVEKSMADTERAQVEFQRLSAMDELSGHNAASYFQAANQVATADIYNTLLSSTEDGQLLDVYTANELSRRLATYKSTMMQAITEKVHPNFQEQHVKNLERNIAGMQASIDLAKKSGVTTELRKEIDDSIRIYGVAAYPLIAMAKEAGGEQWASIFGTKNVRDQIEMAESYGMPDIIDFADATLNLTKLHTGKGDGLVTPSAVGATLGSEELNDSLDRQMDVDEEGTLTALRKAAGEDKEGVTLAGINRGNLSQKAAAGDQKARAKIGAVVSKQLSRIRTELSSADISQTEDDEYFRQRRESGKDSVSNMYRRSGKKAPEYKDRPTGVQLVTRTVKTKSGQDKEVVDFEGNAEYIKNNGRVLKQLYGVLKKNPWYWEESYENEVEAFNAIMSESREQAPVEEPTEGK